MKTFSELQESLKNKKAKVEAKSKLKEGDKDPCWKDYQQVGMKKKNGKEVPNCVPKEEVEEGKKPVSQMTPAEKAANDKRRKEYNAYQKSKRNEGKLPPHLAKFFDKKGNLNKDAEERVKKGRKAKGLDQYTGKKLESVEEALKKSYKDIGTYTVAFRNKNGKIESEISAPSKEKAEKQVAIRNKKVKPSEGAWEVIKTGSVKEALKKTYKDTGTYTVAFRNKNGKIEAEVSAKSKESAEKQVAIRNKKVKWTEGKWEVIKTGSVEESVNEARKYSVLDTKKNEIVSRPNITKAAAQKLVDKDPDNRIMGSPEFIHDKRTNALKENYGVMSKRAFKRQEHEFEAELDRRAEAQRKANESMSRVIWIDGKVWKKNGKAVEFNDMKHAQNVIKALSKKNPDKDFTAGSMAYYKQEGDTLKHKLKTKK